MTEDEMVGWHHQLNRHGFGWTPGVGDVQGSLACCSPRGSQGTGYDLATEQQQHGEGGTAASFWAGGTWFSLLDLSVW